MTKTQLIEIAAQKAESSKKCVSEIYDALFETIVETLQKGETVQIAGFGAFAVKTRAARNGINPATKEAIEIPESKYLAFSASKSIKDKLN